MITKLKFAHLFIFLIALQLSSLCMCLGPSRVDVNSAHKTINGSASTGHPHPQFFYPQTHPAHTTVDADGRDPRQWMSSYGYGSPYLGMGLWGGTEVLIVSDSYLN